MTPVYDACMTPFDYLHRAPTWLIGLDHSILCELTARRLAALQSYAQPPTIFLAESDPVAFMAGFIAATTAQCPLFLCNPTWTPSEWQQVFALAIPDLVWGTSPDFAHDAAPTPSWRHSTTIPRHWIMIPTGGSSGQIRFAIHSWETLTAAVTGLQAYFQVEQINSCTVLPLYHVSGLMQFLRSLVTDGQLAILPFKQLAPHQLNPTDFWLSLVPTQLQKLLQDPANLIWLSRFRTVFLGGAPAWEDLLNQARQHHIPLAPTYGMTETAAQIATLRPADFLQGQQGCGQVLPHAALTVITNEVIANEVIAHGNTNGKQPVGRIAIQAKSLMLGYFPNASPPLQQFLTDDLGYVDGQGNLQIVGRSSRKIITGGENVFPTEVEEAIRATGLVADVCVVGMPDQIWGEAVVALCVAMPKTPSKALSETRLDGVENIVLALQTALAPRLSRYKQPKQWIWVDQIPRNAQGKVSDIQLKRFLSSDHSHTHLLPRQSE